MKAPLPSLLLNFFLRPVLSSSSVSCQVGFRFEQDSLGRVQVPEERLYGAQTARCLKHFDISTEKMPVEFLLALARLKRAAAKVNEDLLLLPPVKTKAIVGAVNELFTKNEDFFREEFPLSIWQTGSATQTNMNMNEVLANMASEILGGERGMKRLIHPNNDVNFGTSSNDIIPSALHVGLTIEITEKLLPALKSLRLALEEKSSLFKHIIKIGRTHLQDATPLTLGQEFSGYAAQLKFAENAIKESLEGLKSLAIGGTAVGTGLNTHPEFPSRVVRILSQETDISFKVAENKFAALAGHEPIVYAHGALKSLATALMKIANDIRWMASGPRAGLSEINIPENEAGSSIMPGKVNPTQPEAITMISTQIIGNDAAIAIAAASGNFELNVFKPLILHNFFQSVRILTDGMKSFREFCVIGITPNRERIHELMEQSLMLITVLNPHIGYDKSAAIAQKAHREGISLKQAAVDSGYVSESDFDLWVKPELMIEPSELLIFNFTSKPEYTLHYWPIRGRAEPIRLTMVLAGLNWKEVHYTDEMMTETKKLAGTAASPFGQWPLLSEDGQIFCQTHAIVKYLGRKYNMYGSTKLQDYFVDSLLVGIEALRMKYSEAKNVENKSEALKSFEEKHLNPSTKTGVNAGAHMAYLDGYLQRSKTSWAAGGQDLSIADIFLFNLYDMLRTKFQHLPSLYPKIEEHHQSFSRIQSVKEFLVSNKRFDEY